jgi:hypothetical protein
MSGFESYRLESLGEPPCRMPDNAHTCLLAYLSSRRIETVKYFKNIFGNKLLLSKAWSLTWQLANRTHDWAA